MFAKLQITALKSTTHLEMLDVQTELSLRKVGMKKKLFLLRFFPELTHFSTTLSITSKNIRKPLFLLLTVN